MRVWRICDARFPELDGEGARIAGGRWNSPGRAVVYTSNTLSLAVLENLIHYDPDLTPSGQICLGIDIPDDMRRQEITPDSLPTRWRQGRSDAILRRLGNQWIDGGRTAVLLAPSVIVPSEQNVLLNPAHPDMADMRIAERQPFGHDPRLID